MTDDADRAGGGAIGAPDAASTYPADTSLAEVISGFEAEGFTGQVDVDDETGTCTCASCGARSTPDELVIEDARRLEGASDPAEMSCVLGVSCPQCGQRAIAVCRYGPEASSGEASLLRAARGTTGG